MHCDSINKTANYKMQTNKELKIIKMHDLKTNAELKISKMHDL